MKRSDFPLAFPRLSPSELGDFPAAHSMDSEWFAVDGQGRVAIFVSDEAGSIPEEDCYADQGLIYSAMEELARSRPYFINDLTEIADGEFYCCEEIPGERAKGPNRIKVNLEAQAGSNFSEVLLWLTREEGLDRLPMGERGSYRLFNPDRILVFVDTLAGEILLELRERGLLARGWWNYRFEPRRFGIFRYDFPSYDGQDPYQRSAIPDRPIISAELPEEMRGKVEKLCFSEADFSEDETVQPRDFVSCVAWGE